MKFEFSQESKETLDRLNRSAPRFFTECPHSRVPPKRRVFIRVTPPNNSEKLDLANLYREWFPITLVEQTLHFAFRQEYGAWLRNHDGGYPVPVQGTGFGCVRALSPFDLLALAVTYDGKDFSSDILRARTFIEESLVGTGVSFDQFLRKLSKIASRISGFSNERGTLALAIAKALNGERNNWINAVARIMAMRD